MLRDGTVEATQASDPSPYDGDNMGGAFFIWERTKAPAYRDKPGIRDALNARVWAKNERHAVKIVNERRAAMIASGEWRGASQDTEKVG